MRIGELAQVTGTQVETIRYYEKERLLPEPGRSDGNYRVYGPEHVDLLQFIRHCRALDMSLEEVRVLLRLRDAPAEDCGDVDALLDEHIGHVVQRIKALRSLERQLKDLRARCASESDAAHCGILSELAAAARARPVATTRERHLGGVHAPKRRR
jgi:Cd(II)/Pb(II)-responsive transcriptional regulator